MSADKLKTEKRTIQVGDEKVEFEAVIGRNVPRHVEEKDDGREEARTG